VAVDVRAIKHIQFPEQYAERPFVHDDVVKDQYQVVFLGTELMQLGANQ